MKILYVGDLTVGGTCYDRMVALQEIGYETVGVNVAHHFARSRAARSVQWRFSPRPLLTGLNFDILSTFKSRSDFHLVWVDKGVWVFPETLASLKSTSGVPIVHYTPDPQILFNRTSHFIRSIRLYDYLITTKSREQSLYRQLGARHVIFARQSYCRKRYSNPVKLQSFAAGVGFIGHCESHYRRMIAWASPSVADVRVWGRRWPLAAMLGAVPKAAVQGEGVYGEAYVNALASFRIGLGLLTKLFPEQHTTRSLEIPAAGTFLLAERTNEHLEMFREGEEAEFFGGPEEMVDKARFYLANESKRSQIAARGRARCEASGYENVATLRRVFAQMQL